MPHRLAAIVLLILSLVGGPLGLAASACGGFFCATAPIDQSGEKILFLVEGQKLTAYVQIQYQGSAEDFSWVVPVPALPTLSVGSDEIFARLERATQVQYQLQFTNPEGTCKTPGGGFAVPTMANGATEDRAAGVTVVSQQVVGPYDSAILKADTVAELQEWLTTNNYTIPPRFDEVTKTYVKKDNYFIALRLRRDRDTGDLAPIVFSYNSSEPCVPLILTSIAARPNMPITVYVLGPGRAIPLNYRHVQVNEAMIDWLNGGRNYNDLVTRAVDEGGGRAFVTDIAVKSSTLQPTLASTYNLSGMEGATNAWSAVLHLQNQNFPTGPQLQAVLKRHIPMPDSLQGQVSETQFYSTLWSYQSQLSQQAMTPEQALAFKQELDTVFVKPLVTAHEAFGRVPYLTRFYTTMSADEMTVDPILDYNTGLPDVSNIRTAEATILCSPNLTTQQAPIRIKLKDGTTFAVTRNQPVSVPDMPTAMVVEQLNPIDPGTVVQDNRQQIQNLLNKFASVANAVSAAEKVAGVGPGCGCNLPGGAPANPLQGAGEAGVYGLAYVGIFGYLRFRRKQR